MTDGKSRKLGEILCEEGLLDEVQLHRALDTQKNDNRRLGELLVDKGWVADDKLAEVLARMFQLPYLRLSEMKVDEKVLGILSHDLLVNYRVLPVRIEGQTLTLATSNPLDVSALQDIQYKSGFMINLVMASGKDIDQSLQIYADSLHTINSIKTGGPIGVQDAPVIQLVEKIIRQAIRERASDIHFEPQTDHLRIRFRIDGVLYAKEPVDKTLERNVLSRIKIISNMDVAENRRPQDGRMSFRHDNKEFDLRISTLPNIHGENLALRILSKTLVGSDFKELGMEKDDTQKIKTLLERPYGIMLVTGPTGAGKTTTLYTMLQYLNSIQRNIISVEDPVEYEIKGINQTNINSFIGYTFANSIRHILRHDPDVIMVGEIRDVETAETSIRAALTGHLVISTMHTNTAAGAITRLLEMGIEPFLISSAMIGVVAQRLVRTLCPKCRKEFQPSREIIDQISAQVPFDQHQTLAQAVGCSECLKSGFNGRTAIFELLSVDQELQGMILKSSSEQDIIGHARRHGMRTLRHSGLIKAVQKITTLEEVLHTTFLG